MTPLATAMLLALIHGSLVILATALVQACLPRRFAAARVTIGTVGLTVLMALTFLAFMPLPSVWTNGRPAPERARRARVGVTDPAGQFAAVNEVPPRNERGNLAHGMRLPIEWLRRVDSSLEQATVAAETSSAAWRWPLLVVLLGGSAFSLIKLLFAIRSLGRLRTASRPVLETSVVELASGLACRCGLRCPIELRELDQHGSAATFGWARPVIMLPASWRTWSCEELSAALAHEIAHVQRADYLQRLIAHVAAAIHFYHPLVRSLVRRLTIDQEFAADQLAQRLTDRPAAYTRGLAQLALRYHESLSDKPVWPSVSVMPRSSDFLARRLEMLRVENRPNGRWTAKLIASSASIALVAIALATALLRGAKAADEAAASEKPVAETARLETKKIGTLTPPGQANGQLFQHEPFDPSLIRSCKHGGFLIRIGEILRDPKFAKYVPELNTLIPASLTAFSGMQVDSLDVRQIEWIAGNLYATTKPPKAPGGKSTFMLGAQAVVIRLNRAADWQEIVLKNVRGSSLEMTAGRSYVQLRPIPELGPGTPILRFPNDTTIIAFFGNMLDQDEDREKVFSRFFDDSPGDYSWIKTWQAVDGGLGTFVFDNREVGWHDLPAEDTEFPQAARPLVEKTQFFGITLDWNETTDRAALRIRSACANVADAERVRQATLIVLADWKKQLLAEKTDASGEPAAEATFGDSEKLLKNLASAKVRLGAEDPDSPFVETTADVFLAIPATLK